MQTYDLVCQRMVNPPSLSEPHAILAHNRMLKDASSGPNAQRGQYHFWAMLHVLFTVEGMLYVTGMDVVKK